MKRILAVATATFAVCSVAAAQTLPPVKVSSANPMPGCATPGRLMAYLAERNPKLDPRFAAIATYYMRHGEQLGIRWDYAFYQMILETGSLSFTRNGTKPGDVKPRQNNFAGIGATGGGEPGESFKSVEDGVLAHLQHLQMYAGERVDSPVAERTRKVQEWGVLTSWQKGFRRPITFADLAGKWAPGSRGYASHIHKMAEDFQSGACRKPDPRPEMVAEARTGRTAPARTAAAPTRGDELVRAEMERARSEGAGNRRALGAAAITAARPYGGETAPLTGVTILNEQAAETPSSANSQAAGSAPGTPPAGSDAATAEPPPASRSRSITAKGAGTTPRSTQVAAAATLPKPPAVDAPAAAGKCRVFTASYGGQKAVIIRASADQFTNFTVLDVNEGQEVREVEAYIAAYARGGQKVGEFSSSDAALDKAFQLCPES
jgi:hypothetical protein